VFISDTHEDCVKLAGLIESHICLSDIVNELSIGEKCMKWVHHRKNKSRFMKKTIIGIQWWKRPHISIHCPQKIPDTKNIITLCDE